MVVLSGIDNCRDALLECGQTVYRCCFAITISMMNNGWKIPFYMDQFILCAFCAFIDRTVKRDREII
jgi:hypothetical protein